MNQDELRAVFQEWRGQHQRDAWKPVAGSDSATSWFGGDPDPLPQTWPCCAGCKKPMQFFLQLDLSALPNEYDRPRRNGILQFFYCSVDDGSCETWAAFTGTHSISIRSDRTGAATRPHQLTPFPKVSIASWEHFSDSPHPEDHEGLGLRYHYDFKKNVVSVGCSEPKIKLDNLDIDLEVAETISTSESGDKLGGWPFWVQSAEYPTCPECGSKMNLLMQVDSQDNLPYMFGDLGCGHLTQCPQHPDVLAFGWACG